jgi:hypothetical protein
LRILLLIFLLCGSARAAERVAAFHSDIRIAPGGTLVITETIEVQAEGKEIRGGILRDFPTGYRDRYGSRVSVPLEVLKVTRNGQPEHFALERLANGTRIRIGEASRTLPQGKHVYLIAYRTAHQIGFFSDHDELYWNVNGEGWPFALDRLTAEVTFEEPVPAGDLKVEAFTGPQGARGHDFNAFVRHGSAAFRATRPLAPGEGMTIAVAFPKGVIAAPSPIVRVGRFVSANNGVPAGIAAFGAMLAFLFASWRRFGRGLKPGPVFPRYEPPAGIGPAGVRFIDRQGYDERCFAAALLGLGSRGLVKIRQRETGDRYEVERTAEPTELYPGEDTLVKSMFPSSQPFDFGKAHDSRVEAVRDDFAKSLEKQFGRSFYARNSAIAILGLLIAGAGVAAMFLLDTPAWIMALLILAMLGTLVLFAWKLMPVQGRKVQSDIEGLREYLSVAQEEDPERMKAPLQTPEEFSRFLPYALALGVEKTWAERFAAVLGAAAVAAAVSEFYQTENGNTEISSVTDSLTDIGDTIRAASTPAVEG